MSLVHHLTPWVTQPVGRAVPDARLAGGLLVYGQHLREVMTGNRAPDFTGSSGIPAPSVGPGGLGVRGAPNVVASWQGSRFKSSTEYTVIAVVVDDSLRSSSDRNPLDGDSQTSPRVFQLRFKGSNNAPEFIAFNTGGSPFFATGSVASSANGLSVLCGRIKGNEASVWLNGRKAGAGTITGTPQSLSASGSTLSVGASRVSTGTVVQHFSGQIFLCAYLPLALSDAELAAIGANPWQLFRPRVVEVFTEVAGGSTVAASAGIAAALQSQRASAASLAAGLRVARSASASVAAAMQRSRTAAASAAAAVQAGRAASSGATAAVQARRAAAASLSATSQSGRAATASASSAVRASRSATAALAASLQAIGSGQQTASVAAAVQARRTASASIAASIAAEGARSATADLAAALRLARTAGASVSAAAQKARLASASLAAMAILQRIASSSLAAALLGGKAASAQLRAYVVSEAGDVDETYPLSGLSQGFPLAGASQTYPLA